MKAILEFDLPEESVDHQLALHGIDLKIAIDEFDNYLRGLIKHEEKYTIETQAVRDKLWECINESDAKELF